MDEGVQITKRELYELVWSEPMTSLAKRFKLSPNGLAKICDRLDIDRPPKGYWANPDPALAPDLGAIEGADEVLEIGGRRHAARRRQTRMPFEERRQQILDVARRIVLEEGAHQVSLRGIARQIGISEAQAHNCFETRTELLVELTMRELNLFEGKRQEVVTRGENHLSKVLLSTLLYLDLAAERGALQTRLLSISEIKKAVAARRHKAREAVQARQIAIVMENRGISQDQAIAEVDMLSSLTLRAGSLVSCGVVSSMEAQQIILPAIVQTASGKPG